MTIAILSPLTAAETAANRAGAVVATIRIGRRAAVTGDLAGARFYLRRARRQLSQVDETLVTDGAVLEAILVGMRVLSNLVAMGADA